MKGMVRPWPLLGFPWDRQAGMVNRLGLARLNHFIGLWSTGVVASGRAPGPGMIKVEEYCSRVQGQLGEGARRDIASRVQGQEGKQGGGGGRVEGEAGRRGIASRMRDRWRCPGSRWVGWSITGWALCSLRIGSPGQGHVLSHEGF